MQASLKWQDGLTFVGQNDSGHTVMVTNDRDEQGERTGISPIQLTALSLGGCTAMDVISILKKKRQAVSDFEVVVRTERVEEYPRVWSQAEIEFIVRGKDIDPAAVERAIELSAEKYCSVSNMLRQGVEISHSYKIIEA